MVQTTTPGILQGRVFFASLFCLFSFAHCRGTLKLPWSRRGQRTIARSPSVAARAGKGRLESDKRLARHRRVLNALVTKRFMQNVSATASGRWPLVSARLPGAGEQGIAEAVVEIASNAHRCAGCTLHGLCPLPPPSPVDWPHTVASDTYVRFT